MFELFQRQNVIYDFISQANFPFRLINASNLVPEDTRSAKSFTCVLCRTFIGQVEYINESSFVAINRL